MMMRENPSRRQPRFVRGSVALVMCLIATWSGRARAHLQPIPLALWGGFDTQTAQCQRAIIFIAARCSMIAWTARNACLAAQLNGRPCNTDGTDAKTSSRDQGCACRAKSGNGSSTNFTSGEGGGFEIARRCGLDWHNQTKSQKGKREHDCREDISHFLLLVV